MGRIFISHQNNPADNEWSQKLHRWIKDEKGINGFLDFDIQDGLTAGQDWEQEIYAAIRRAQVVIAVVSQAWLKSHWCTSEARMARLLGLKLILFITEECEVPFRGTQSIRFEKHGEERAFEELRQALRATHNLPERPYPGLAAFDEKDAAVFFGREDETRELVNEVNSLFQGRPNTPRILLVLGASGSGKSSLMRAGFLSEFKADPKNLCLEPIIPRGDALGEIAEVLDVSLDGFSADAAADAIIAAMKRAHPHYRQAVICVDQAEELLEESGAFFDVMRSLLDKRQGRVIVLATMRSDFLNEFQNRRLIGPDANLAYKTLPLDPLPEDHLGAIIRQPAELFGVEYEDELFDQIKKDHSGPDALPLLAFFLNEFWDKEFYQDGVLQLAEYEKFGGVGQALEQAKDRAIEDCVALDHAYTDRQALLDDIREIFLGLLVSVSASSGAVVRNRAPASVLTERQTALLSSFARQRLLIEKDGMWEVAHEALLRQWAELKAWIDAAREDLIAIDRVEAAAAQWGKEGRLAADLTHGGNRLAEAFRMLDNPRYAERFDDTATAYLKACQQKESERYEQEKSLRETAERERDQAEAESRRALKNQRLALAALSSTELKSEHPSEAALLALAAWPPELDPEQDTDDYDVVLNALSEACIAMREQRRFEPQGGEVHCVAVSPDGKCLAAGTNDGSVSLWEIGTGRECLRLENHAAKVYGIAFSPDGTRLATACEDGVARIWDTDNGQETARLIGQEADRYEEKWVFCVAFSPDGFLLATAGVDGTIRIWDLETNEQVARLEGHETEGDWRLVFCVTFSSDGTRLASGGVDGTARVWDIATGEETATLKGHGKWVRGVALSPDGTLLATAGYDGTARLWDLNKTTGWTTVFSDPEIARFEGHGGWLTSVAFSPDGLRLATGGGWDSKARIWDIAAREEILTLEGHEDSVFSIAFQPDGAHLATASKDGTVRLWDIARGSEVMRIGGDTDEVDSVAFSPDGSCIATGNKAGGVWLWDLPEGREPHCLSIFGSPVSSISFSANGSRLTAGFESSALVWDHAADRELSSHELIGDLVFAVALSPCGATLATVGTGGTVILWNVETAQETARFAAHETPELEESYDDWVHCVAFSPDGTILATGGEDGTAQLWDVQTGARIRWLEAHGPCRLGIRKGVRGVAFSADGTRLATCGVDGLTRLWNIATGDEILQLKSSWQEVYSVAFSPDGTRLATGEDDGSGGIARLWDLATGKELARLAGHKEEVVSVAFSPDGTRIATAGDDGTVRLWNVDYGPGNLFEVLRRRLPTHNPPAILATYGIELNERFYSGEDALPTPVEVLETAGLSEPLPTPPLSLGADLFRSDAPPIATAPIDPFGHELLAPSPSDAAPRSAPPADIDFLGDPLEPPPLPRDPSDEDPN